MDFGSQVRIGRTAVERRLRSMSARIRKAWRSADRGSLEQENTGVAATSVDEAFSPINLLPSTYNQRLDAAAPGIFTAVGIFGTFVGLILGFIRVDPTEAGTAISPILGGMVVAFLNSAFGVALSIYWTLRSRVVRLIFDNACETVSDAITEKFGTTTHSSLLQQSLGRIESQLVTLSTATQESSEKILRGLSDSVTDSFRQVIDLPLNHLTARITELGELVEHTARNQIRLGEQLTETATSIGVVEERLRASLETSQLIVEEFNKSVGRMTDSSTLLADIGATMEGSATAFQAATSSLVLLSQTIDSLGTALAEQLTALSTSTERFERASEQLESAVGTITSISTETARESAASVHTELQQAIELLNESLTAASERTIGAYETSTTRVIETVDGRVTDLSDRLSAELTTLSQRLPEHLEGLNNATRRVSQQLNKATTSIEHSLEELGERTPRALSAHLGEYDRLLGQALSQFSGTLMQWEGRVTELVEHSRNFAQLAESLARRSNGHDAQGQIS